MAAVGCEGAIGGRRGRWDELGAARACAEGARPVRVDVDRVAARRAVADGLAAVHALVNEIAEVGAVAVEGLAGEAGAPVASRRRHCCWQWR